MATTITVPVTLYRSAQPAFTTGDVSFTPDPGGTNNGAGTLTLVDARSLTETQAREELALTLAVVQLVAGGPVKAEVGRMTMHTTNAAGGGTGMVSLPAGACIVRTPYTASDEASIGTGIGTLAMNATSAAPTKQAALLRLALRWYAIALAEPDTLQSFIAAWIALEAFCRPGGKNNIDGVERKVKQLYAGYQPDASARRVRKIYEKYRNPVFHEAKLPALGKAREDLLKILRDVLASELGLTPTYEGATAV